MRGNSMTRKLFAFVGFVIVCGSALVSAGKLDMGGAKVEIPGRSYRAHRLAGLREDALTGAVEAVWGVRIPASEIQAYLRKTGLPP